MSPFVPIFELMRRGLETMKDYAQVRGAEYQPFGFLKTPKLIRTYRGCQITYFLRSESSGDNNAPPTLTTRIRAPFPNTSDFTFSINHRSKVARFLNKHGKHSAETGDTEFDEAYAVRSSDPEMVRLLLSDSAYRDVLKRTVAGLSIDDRKEDGLLNKRFKDVHFVKFFVYGFISEVAEIDLAFECVDRTLDRLAQIGQARLPD